MRRIAAFARNPVTIASILSSFSGAGVVLAAAATMGVAAFSTFSLAYLMLTVLIGLVRAGLFQPALIHRRIDPDTSVALRYLVVAMSGCAVAIFGALILLGAAGSLKASLLAVGTVAPVWYEFLKHRHMASGSNWLVAAAEGGRLLLVPATLVLPPRADTYYSWTLLGYLIAALIVCWTAPRASTFTPYRRYARQALAQAGDFTVGQLSTSLPLLLFGVLSPGSPSIGAVRFAQIVLGPLNLLFTAITNTLLVEGVRSNDTDRDLISAGRFTARCTAGIAVVAVLAGWLAVTWLGLRPSGVAAQQLSAGVVLVGVVAIASAWSGVQMVVLRLIGEAVAVFWTRLVVVGLTIVGYLAGWLIDGLDGAMIAGFSTQAVAFVVAFAVTTRWASVRHAADSGPQH